MNALVLVVDFEPRSAGVTRDALAARGYKVAVATNARELGPYLAHEPPALVVLEPMLPGLDGFRCIGAFKSVKGTPPYVVAASRIFKGPRFKNMAREAGADLVLERPQDDEQLAVAVEEHVGALRSRSFSQPCAAAPRVSGPVGEPEARLPATGTTGNVQAHARVNLRTTAAQRASEAVAVLDEDEVNRAVDRMFESCFAAPEAAAVATVAATATPVTHGPVQESDSSGLLSSLAELEHSLPPAPTARDASAPAPATPAEVEPSVPLMPPPRSEDERTLDEMLDRITDSGARAQARAAVAPRPVHVPTRTVTPPAVSTAPERPLLARLAVPVAASVLVVGAIGAYFATRGTTQPAPVDAVPSVSTTQPAGSPAPTPGPGGATTGQVAAAPESAQAAQVVPPAAQPKPATVPASPATARQTPDSGTLRRDRSPVELPTAARVPHAAAPDVASPQSQPQAVQDAGAGGTLTAAAEPAPAPPQVDTTTAATAEEPKTAAAPLPTIVVEPERTGPLAAGVDGVTLPTLIGSSRVNPVYPEIARRTRASGSVTLRALVLEDGTVGEVTLLSEPRNTGFGAAAVAAVKQWRFKPARKDGQPVAVYHNLALKFTP